MNSIRSIAPLLCTLAGATVWAAPGDHGVPALIVSDTTWSRAQSPLVISGRVRVAEGATLTILPGVEVRFEPGADSGLTVNGRLNVLGSAESPVYFTSSRDPGSAMSRFPQSLPGLGARPGDWDGIRIETAAKSSSRIENAIVRYSRNGLVTAGGATVAASHNVFRNNLTDPTAEVRSTVTADLSPRATPTNNLMPSFSTVPTGWTLSRYAPAGFAVPSPTVNGRTSELQIQINQAQGAANRPTGSQTQYYGYQGYSYPLAGVGAGDAISADIYIPSALNNAQAGNAASYMWAVGNNATGGETDYGIVGFTNSVGHGEFTVWDDGINNWVDLATPVLFNSWNTVSVLFTGTTFDYYINGVRVYSMTNNYGTTKLGSTIMDAVNFFDSSTGFTGLNYSMVWSNTLAPVTTTLTSSPNPSNTGQTVTLTATVTPSAATGSVAFVDGLAIIGTAALSNGVAAFPTAGFTAGTHPLTAVYEGDGNYSESTSAAVSQSVTQAFTATATSVSASANPATPGQPITLTATVSPPNAAGSVTFSDGGSPIGTATLSGGIATISVTLTAPPTQHSITASYSGFATFSSSTSSTLTETVAFPQLSVITTSLPSGMAGQAYGPVTLRAMGGSGGALTWTAASLPPGLTLSSAGVLAGTPTTGFNGVVTVTVTDANTSVMPASASLALTITVPPISVSGPSTLGDLLVGASISASYTVTGGASPYTWSISGAPGLNINGSGAVTGTASSPGNFTVTIVVRDSLGNSTSASATLAVFAVATTSLPNTSTTSNYSASISVVGGVPPYTITASGLPPGITFANGVFGGRATTAGSYSIAVQATDSNGLSITVNYSVTVTGSPLLTVTTSSLPNGMVGQAYSQVLTATGGTGSYTWSQSGGVLPVGLSISSSGTVSGTPTAATPAPYTVGIQVTDSSGAQAVGSVSIGILPAALQVTGATFPPGVATAPYPTQILGATGGLPPYTFSITGSLPAGLTFAGGQISGTPTTAGTASFSVVVTDSSTPAATSSLASSITVGPSTTTLVLSSSGASFAITAGTTAAPTPVTVNVTSTNIRQALNFSFTSSVPWLTLSGSPGTPGSITISLNQAALALSATGSPYSGTVTVNCNSTACAAGSTQTIGVTLTVTAAPAQLSVDSSLLSFTAMAASPQSSSAVFNISNAGGGTLGITSITAADSWVGIGTFPSTIAPGPRVPVTVTANPAGLSAGYYRSVVTVTSSVGAASIPVTLLISGAATMTLGPAGAQFSAPFQGAVGNGNGSFLVAVTSTTPVTYTTSVPTPASWLTPNGSGGTASAASPGTVSFSLNQSAVSQLAVGAYYATIRVTASGVVNSPLDFQVILNVTPTFSAIAPDVEPAGLVFIAPVSGASQSQQLQVYASSLTPVTLQASSNVNSGSGWLSTNLGAGTASSSSPGSILVTANPAGLAAGVYTGGVNVSFASGQVRTANITLIVTAPLPTGSVSQAPGNQPKAVTCSSPVLVPTQTGLVSNFSTPASWPTPLAIVLADSCGNLVTNGQVVTTFSNGDPPLPLTLVDATHGLYSGTWTPRNASSQVAIQARASAPNYPVATAQVAGQVAPNMAPVLAVNGTGDIFRPQVGSGLGPGNIVQIYGSSLAGQIMTPATLPLPTVVGGTSVLIGGVASPLYYVSPGQINAQIPFTLAPNQQYQVIVSANGALTTPQPIQLNAGAPAVLAFSSGAVVAQHPDNTLISATSPAKPGENIVIYLTGLGATTVNVPSGSPSPSNPLAYVVNTPTLTLNGNSVSLLFAGLTPSLVGLYQINFQVPPSLTTGNYELTITQGGVTSNTTLLQVQAGP